MTQRESLMWLTSKPGTWVPPQESTQEPRASQKNVDGMWVASHAHRNVGPRFDVGRFGLRGRIWLGLLYFCSCYCLPLAATKTHRSKR
jgi:hypothetical protein